MAAILLLSPDETRRKELTAPLQEAGWDTGSLGDASRLSLLHSEAVPRALLLDAVYLRRDEVEQALECGREWKIATLLILRPDELANPNLFIYGDDFVIEPLRPSELVSRVRRLLQRMGSREGRGGIHLGALSLDHERYEVRVAGRPVRLTYKEYELLRLLASYPGRVFTRDELLSKVWGYDYFGGTRTVDVHIRRLRSNIENADHTFIETIWNVGYRFRSPT